MKYSVIVIDESSVQRLATSILVKNHPKLELIGSYANPYQAMRAIYHQKIDIVILDALMEHEGALELLNNIEINSAIILNSTWSNVAKRVFDYGINDYLMKPMPKKRFVKAIDRIIDQIEQKKMKPTKTHTNSELLSNFSLN